MTRIAGRKSGDDEQWLDGLALVAGYREQRDELVVDSQMPTGGVIFSDGIENDFLEFNNGCIARFAVSEQRARLVVG